ncbi:MAG: APC family permease [Chloroflexi bacterium]|jgi:APA family basic amino acid/polyamine antiporter|nr:APC family permease [Chloroflexota bacterium]
MTATAKPEVFTRKASGLVRVMSPASAFVYNILTMGLIFPWTYLWAPGALPGGKLVWGILLAMVIEIPIALVYVWLSTALPRSGGDYVFQSRVFGGGVAFTVVMSGYVIWILQWVALSGWLLSYLGFAPLFLGLGAFTGSAAMTSLGLWFTGSTGIIITSILNAFVAMMILISGFKNYVRFQSVMIGGTLLAFITMLVVLFTGNPASSAARLDAFAFAISGVENFVQTAKDATVAAGIDLNPPFSMIATLLVAPIAWTSLQWATYSAQQNGEIKNARSFKDQMFIIVGSLIFTGILLAILAAAIEKAVGTEFLYIAGAGYWSLIGEATISGFWLWPNIIAVALSASPLVVVIIGVGYILNSHQIVHNCYIGMTRVMVAMSLDRLLPEWVSKVDDKRHTPANAHWAYFIASIPVILLYNLYPGWVGLTLGVTFACGYVFVITCLAGALLPYRAKDVYESSPGAAYKVGGIPLVTVLGVIGFILGTVFLLMFMLDPRLGLASPMAYQIVFGVLAVSAIWYFISKSMQKSKGIDVDYAFKEIPPE